MRHSTAFRRCALLVAAGMVAGCSVTRRQVDVVVQGDVPATDTRGRRLAPSARAAVGETLARQVTVGFSCRDDEACDPKVSVAPITSKLGRPPAPERIAGEMAPRGPSTDTARQDVRRAYDEAVRTRYRLYAEYLFGQMTGADWIEIAPVRGDAATRRYSGSRVDDGLRENMLELADDYSALEWARFDRVWGTAAGTRVTRPRPATGPGPAVPPTATAPQPAPVTPDPGKSITPPQATAPAREIIIEADPPARAPAAPATPN